jgi:hypothetical protein
MLATVMVASLAARRCCQYRMMSEFRPLTSSLRVLIAAFRKRRL